MILGFKQQFPSKIEAGTKIHSFREDPLRRWKIGMKIQMATGVRTAKFNVFNNQHTVISLQECFMTYDPANGFEVTIEGNYLTPEEIETLATNDGFDSVLDFENWFIPLIKKSETDCYNPVLIHWTDYKY